jgi:hypothetical protein
MAAHAHKNSAVMKTVIEGAARQAIQTGLGTKTFKYTSKAACQIKCYGLQLEDVRQVVSKGKLVKYDTKNEDLTCPLYALEHTLPGKGKVLVLAADCKDATKVVRVAMATPKCNC